MCKNILFVINTLGRAGAEMALLELLEEFNRPDFRVDLLVLMEQGELLDRVPAHVNLLNKRFSTKSVLSAGGRRDMMGTVVRSMFRRGTIFRRIPYLTGGMINMLKRRRFQADKLLWRVLADGAVRTDREYDLAIAAIEGGSAYYVHDYVKAKKKAVFIHIDYELSGYTRELDQNCYPDFDRIFPISEETRNSFLKYYPECREKTVLFHNRVNQTAIREKSLLPGGFTDDFKGTRILTVARLTKQKAYPVAIETMRLLKEAGVNARWYVLGDGEERKNLEQLIRQYGLTQDFLLLGATDNPYPFFKQTDLYVHATAFEGKSIAIQEAQTLACSIIVSDIISNRQQVQDEVDGLVCELSPEALQKAIRRLIDDPELAYKLGQNAANKKVAYDEDMDRLLELVY